MRRSNVRSVNCGNNQREAHKMDPMKLQFRSNNRPGYRNHPFKQHNGKSSLVLYTTIAFVFVFLCYFLLVFPNRSDSANHYYGHKKFGIVIDGGSTGTRIHVFKYEVEKDGILRYDFGKNGLASMKVNPGLSAFAEEPERAASAVAELVEFGRKRVPREYWRETEIRLMATAGMRMLEKGVQDRILEACRTVLRGSGFRFYDDWASVISGSDEGVYAWVVANYALGTLGGDPKQTTGIIELGGASAQMLRKLSKQLNGEDWMWNNLNTLLGNRIYIRINDGGTSENKFLVMVIRDLLNLCEITKGKDNKVVIASNIMQMIMNSSFPWLMVISRSLKENGLSNLVKVWFVALTTQIGSWNTSIY